MNKALNKALNKAITKYVGPDEAAKLMRVLSSPVAETLNEGWEEVVSDFLNPKWEQLFTGTVDERTKEEKLRQYAESWVSGVLLGVIGQGGQAVSKNFTSVEEPKYLKTAKELYGFEPQDYEGTETQKTASGEAAGVSLVQQVRNVLLSMGNAPAVASVTGKEIPKAGTSSSVSDARN